MKILFLGTGAADWVAAEDYDNPEYRRNSSALINGELLIDPGPCVPEALGRFGISPSSIKYIINTHKHSDHYNTKTLEWLKARGNAEYFEIGDGECIQPGDYKIEAMKGNHSVPVVHFLITQGGKKLFYGLDSAWLMYNEVQRLKAERMVDMAILDATIGHQVGDFRIFEHNSLNMVIEMKATLSRYVSRFCITHMAKTLHTGQAQLEADMEKHGILVAYDGFELEI